MKKFLLFLSLIVALSGCNLSEEAQATSENTTENKVWVFAQFNVETENDGLETYYYYGEISGPLYKKIKANQISSGFIHLDKVKYWDNEDIVREYKDEESAGDILFRIEDIRRLELIDQVPKSQPFTEKSESPPESLTNSQ